MFILVITIVGFSGLIAQVLLLRELLVSFYGNELTVGIILANWVILEAAGALVFGRIIDRTKNKLAVFVALSMIFVISFPLCIWGARTFKLILGIPIGLGVGIGSIVWVSLILSLPVSLTHGALFSSCAKIYSLSCKSHAACAGRVYFWETVGTILSGIILTYILIPRLNSFQISGAIAILNIIACLYLLYKEKFGYRMLKWFTAVLLAIFISLFFVPGWSDIHKLSIKKQWQGFQVLDYANSVYGNIVTTQRQEQYTFFSNGKPAITIPYPDLIFIEEFANIPLLFHQEPKKILIISGGAGGLINKLLEVPSVEEIDYVELDPLILNRLMKYPTGLTQRELEDKRVETLNLDGRFFVKQTSSTYDVIYLGLSDPSDLQTNRLFTQEFFAKVKNRLNKAGILTFTLSGSMTYLAADLRDLNASILNSLKHIFSYVRVIPGDYNLFLASDSEAIIKIDSRLINQRIKARDIKTNLLLPEYVNYRFHPRWQDWFNNALKNATKKTNRDFAGFALFKSLCFWNEKFQPGLKGLLLNLEKVNFPSILAFIFGLTITFLILNFKNPNFSRFKIPYSIATTGFFGMLINLVIIFAFQVVYGYLYFEIGMLIAIFMAGAALGSLLLSHYLEGINRDLRLFAGLEIAIILTVVITLSLILSYPQRFVFFILCFVTGFWVGAQFPIANKIYLKNQDNFGRSIGLIYSADLLGGWLAGILSGILFFSLLGIVNTCLVILGFKLSSLIFLVVSGKRI